MDACSRACLHCGQHKLPVEFYGRRNVCRPCFGAQQRTHEWHRRNPERAKALSARWREENAERNRANKAAYYRANEARIKAQAKATTAKHVEEITPAYATWRFTKNSGLRTADVPIEFQETLALTLRIKRALKAANEQ